MTLSIRESPARLPASAPASNATRAPAPAPTETATSPPSPFARLLHGLGHEMQQGETLMRAAMSASGSSRELAPSELLALQAGVYRYSEAVDLTAKLIDRASTGIKTVLQGQ